jgi:hypothetical protein
VLQFTGFGPLDPLPAAQLDYLAAEAIVHGARGLIWFTYWTPNPREAGMEWKGGAVEYDGTRSPRADTLGAVNERARRLSWQFTRWPIAIAHFGGSWPRGATLTNGHIRGLLSAEGGPMTIAAAVGHLAQSWIVINRDRANARTMTLRLAPGFAVTGIYRPPAEEYVANPDTASHVVRIDLPPGGSVALSMMGRLSP